MMTHDVHGCVGSIIKKGPDEVKEKLNSCGGDQDQQLLLLLPLLQLAALTGTLARIALMRQRHQFLAYVWNAGGLEPL